MENSAWAAVTAIASSFQAAALIVVGFWAYFRFQNERTHKPHMEFGVNCNFYGPQGTNYAAEFIITIRNKGYVQQNFNKILLSVRAIDENDPELRQWKDSKPGYGESYDGRLFCPIPLIRDVDVVPESYKPYLVEPGCEETIRYFTVIPTTCKYLLAHARYSYAETLRRGGKPKRPRTTERFMRVEASINK